MAKLMQVSTHQIRYFEEKGMLDPAYSLQIKQVHEFNFLILYK
ncbi:MerR family transcriptional regulator [Paenibacillus barcinonensis]